METYIQWLKKEDKITSHYHGDAVRKLFVAGAAIMVATLPFVNSNLPVPLSVSLIAIITIGLFAGLTNPLQRWVAILNTLIAVFASFVFAYYAVDSYVNFSIKSLLFWTDWTLALVFFASLYYATKTLRGMILQGNGKQ